MLIAPVYEQDKHEWDVYLPQDEWVHLWTGEEYHGGEITVSAELGYTPAFYRKIVGLLIYSKKSEKIWSQINEHCFILHNNFSDKCDSGYYRLCGDHTRNASKPNSGGI